MALFSPRKQGFFVARAVLGSIFGIKSGPPHDFRDLERWIMAKTGRNKGSRNQEFWPVDALRLAERLLVLGLGKELSDENMKGSHP
ncbi:MAG: hypothetical protein NTY19_03660 [Planctomycetota bacterium]|nr:hypothetical protein [Planctomycetota bacterium]